MNAVWSVPSDVAKVYVNASLIASVELSVPITKDEADSLIDSLLKLISVGAVLVVVA